MATKQILHMNPGQGETSYARNSTIQIVSDNTVSRREGSSHSHHRGGGCRVGARDMDSIS
uniref:Uncharacterized protein n=1 Tax=Oryza meridionalis TaxID=40149 RepID=A0A0E0E1D9_9ORYZ